MFLVSFWRILDVPRFQGLVTDILNGSSDFYFIENKIFLFAQCPSKFGLNTLIIRSTWWILSYDCLWLNHGIQVLTLSRPFHLKLIKILILIEIDFSSECSQISRFELNRGQVLILIRKWISSYKSTGSGPSSVGVIFVSPWHPNVYDPPTIRRMDQLVPTFPLPFLFIL